MDPATAMEALPSVREVRRRAPENREADSASPPPPRDLAPVGANPDLRFERSRCAPKGRQGRRELLTAPVREAPPPPRSIEQPPRSIEQPPPVPGTRIGHGLRNYRVQHKLAEGGMAEVFLCSAVNEWGFSKDVVVKRIRPCLANEPDFVRMFVREARITARLSHPNIVQVLDFASDVRPGESPTQYLVMEYVKGTSLFHLLQKLYRLGERLPVLLSAHLCQQVARGLDAAHRPPAPEHGRPRLLGVVHRDVSPQNILLSHAGEVKLSDFGIAKAKGLLTRSGVVKGKVRYMSPEQARGLPLDGRSDVFALGIVLWEALTGSRLFRATSDVGTLKAVCLAPIPSPLELVPSLPPALCRIVMKALERDLARRYQTAREMSEALQYFLLVHARKPEELDVGALVRAHC